MFAVIVDILILLWFLERVSFSVVFQFSVVLQGFRSFVPVYW
jgi:hypothetical protein